jgi:threonine/homoserine/homoserine lactone efflux protein
MEWLLAVLGFAVTMSITPGPNNIMVTASAANFGVAPTMPHILGISVGFPVMLVALGLGPGQVLIAYPQAHFALKLAGAAYLVFLAWKIASASGVRVGEAKGRPLTFTQAALFQWLNPKAWVIALGALTAYTTVGGAVVTETLVIAAIFVPICVVACAVWAVGGVALRRVLQAPTALRVFNVAMALLLLATLVPMLA